MKSNYFLTGLAVVAAIAAAVYFIPGDKASTDMALAKLTVATGFVLLALISLLSVAVLLAIANGTISLTGLLSETDGKGASMSRFQLLIFTLVIALSLFLVIISKMAFPPSIPPEILTLLGISGTTYAVSKGIQASGPPVPPVPAPVPPVTPIV